MRYWLFKSEPSDWCWDDQVARGDAGEQWDGVRNYQARNIMREMALGDRGFFYHTQKERAVVGIVEVSAEAHPDSTTETALGMRRHPRARAGGTAVTLDGIKADPRLAEMALVRQPRLSVQPVRAEAWRIICAMAGVIRPERRGPPAHAESPELTRILPQDDRTFPNSHIQEPVFLEFGVGSTN